MDEITSVCLKIDGFLSRQCKMESAKCKSKSTTDSNNEQS